MHDRPTFCCMYTMQLYSEIAALGTTTLMSEQTGRVGALFANVSQKSSTKNSVR